MATFSLAGTLRIVPTWVDALDLTTITDKTTASLVFALEHGSGAGQANCYWRDVITVADGDTVDLDLTNLPTNTFGGAGSMWLANVKILLIENRSETISCAIQTTATNRWDGWTDATYVVIDPLGVIYAVSPGAGYTVGNSSKILSITNGGGAAADVAIYLVGVLD
jgi:hypothetical protein